MSDTEQKIEGAKELATIAANLEGFRSETRVMLANLDEKFSMNTARVDKLEARMEDMAGRVEALKVHDAQVDCKQHGVRLSRLEKITATGMGALGALQAILHLFR